jgi:peptidoglycan/xylan/chitin deacetylase (PgdA/CDA1 family)
MRAILTYHSVDESGSPISISPDVFRRHHAWFTGGAIRVLSLDELVTAGPQTGDAVAVTFDDGFMNTRGSIETLLADGVPVTIFAVTGHVGGANNWGGRDAPGIPTLPLLGWDDLASLASRGTAIAAHTRTHPALTTLPAQAVDDELLGAREDLVQRLGVRSPHLAYPYGDVNTRVLARTSEYYAWGHTTEFRPLAAGDAPLLLPRLDMYYFQRPGILEAWGTPRFRRHVAWCRARRRVRAALGGSAFRGHEQLVR